MDQNMENEAERYLEIPPKALAPEALSALIDEFILREGTDYGHGDVTMESKRSQVRHQVDGGHVRILFSSKTENCTLMLATEVPKDQRL